MNSRKGEDVREPNLNITNKKNVLLLRLDCVSHDLPCGLMKIIDRLTGHGSQWRFTYSHSFWIHQRATANSGWFLSFEPWWNVARQPCWRLFPSPLWYYFIVCAYRQMSGYSCFIYGRLFRRTDHLTLHQFTLSFILLSVTTAYPIASWPSFQDEADIILCWPWSCCCRYLKTSNFHFLYCIVQPCHVFSCPISSFPSIENYLLHPKLESWHSRHGTFT